MAITFAISPDAQRMLDEADEQWSAEHGYADDNPLFRQVDHARDLLLDNPELGIAIKHERRLTGAVRRLLLGSGWHLYYRHVAATQHIEVLAVWLASRGHNPLL